MDGSLHCETDADHVRERATVEFFHDARLVDFDGPRADPELSRDVAVLTARRYECEDLSFAGSQALKAPRRSRPRGCRGAPLAIGAQRVLQHIQQHLVIHRLLEEVERAVPECRAHGRDVTMCGKDHDRQVDLPLPQRDYSQLASGQPGKLILVIGEFAIVVGIQVLALDRQ